jgi:hypothetical protein
MSRKKFLIILMGNNHKQYGGAITFVLKIRMRNIHQDATTWIALKDSVSIITGTYTHKKICYSIRQQLF